MRRYDAIVFDLIGTLIDNFSRREYERVLADMADALGIARCVRSLLVGDV